jgi:isopentenyldiphosphate isomerase
MKLETKQLKESFFNPILHFLPLLIFLVVDDFFGINAAWTVSIPASLMILFYVYYFHARVFPWHINFTLMFIGLSMVVYGSTLIGLPLFVIHISDEIIFFVFLLSLIVLRPTFEKVALAVMPKKMPMTNNFEELFRVIKVLIAIILGYTFVFLFFHLFADSKVIELTTLNYVYAGCIIAYVIYELIRVQMIRMELMKEVWWPIVNEHGIIVGNVQSQISLADKEKFTHPVIRVHMIDKGMIFLQKRNDDDPYFGGMWDVAIFDHIQMGETMEECIHRNFEHEYGLKNPKYMHLSNYRIESKQENQYAFLYVTCQVSHETRYKCGTEKTKWWTQKQIEENLEAGIFTDNFVVEYDLLKRSGLLESGKCECACRLKQTIYNLPIYPTQK